MTHDNEDRQFYYLPEDLRLRMQANSAASRAIHDTWAAIPELLVELGHEEEAEGVAALIAKLRSWERETILESRAIGKASVAEANRQGCNYPEPE